MRKLIFFLAAVSLVLFAEKALCYETTFSIEPESFNSLRYEEIASSTAAPLSIRTGRFLSVDPKANSARPGPQTWNRYAYARNNPIAFTDPDGRDVRYLDAKGRPSKSLETYYTRLQSRNERVANVFAAFAPGTGRDLVIRAGDPGRHGGTGKPRDGVTNSTFREATPEQLRAAHDAAGGGAAGTAAAETLMNKGQQLVAAEIVLSPGATEFTKVHEVGHVEQALQDPQTVLANSEAANNARTHEEYKNNPTEVYADEFARDVLDGQRPPR